jgi:hypothetical protein
VRLGSLSLRRATVLLGLAALATGVALLVYFLAGVSLRLSLLATLATAAWAAWLVWHRLAPVGRAEIARRVRVGLLAGALALVGYDLSRLLYVRVSGSAFWPFETFRLFGQLLAGPDASPAVILLTGTVYHVANGLSFAVAYTVLFGYRGWWAGLLWALMLESLMLACYPAWLGLRSLNDFLVISLLGHSVYGLILGTVSRRLLLRPARNGGPPGGAGPARIGGPAGDA